MSVESDETAKIAHDFDESACEFCDRYKSSGLSSSSKTLLNYIIDEGLSGRSVLELGCGVGGFSVEALKRGAGSSVGIDLSPKMIAAANELAANNGFQARAIFELGNAATVDLPVSDLVVMDKVICCYSEINQLLRNAVQASRVLVGFVVPRDEGIVKWPLKVGVWVMNLFQTRRGAAQFYLHPLRMLDKKLKDSGFICLKKSGSRFWLVFLYKRVGPHSTESRASSRLIANLTS